MQLQLGRPKIMNRKGAFFIFIFIDSYRHEFVSQFIDAQYISSCLFETC